MSGLFFAENIAGTPDIHIVAGQRKTGAQRIQRLQDIQPTLGYRLKFLLLRHRKIAITADFRAPYPSLELIQLCQSEHVRTVDYHGIDRRHVNPGFDNRG